MLGFLFFEFYKQVFANFYLGQIEHVVNASNWFLCWNAAVSITYPLDVVRARMAMQQMKVKKPKYNSFLDCLVKLPQEKGISSVQGLRTTIVSVGPYAGTNFSHTTCSSLLSQALWVGRWVLVLLLVLLRRPLSIPWM